MTTQFFVPSDRIRGDRISLPEDEARHAGRVLRLRVGDEFIAVDGEGGWYRIVVDHVGRSEAAGHVVERRREVGEPCYRLRIATGLIKHRGRYETFLEKAVELGVTEIVPIVTARTEKERLRAERAENILIAAMKQCGRSRIPLLHEPTALADILEWDTPAGFCCHASGSPSLAAALRSAGYPTEMTMLIGPEGGFTEDEISRIRAAGYVVVSLGARRLRAETAGITAAAGVALTYDAGM